MLSEKIINLRKSRGWSQEELAERLNVSRQSVSKWESGISNPDLDKIVAMSALFGVSTDYLLKDSTAEEREPIRDFVREDEENNEKIFEQEPLPTREVSAAKAEEYLAVVKRVGPRIALGVLLCILSPVALILLGGLSDFRLLMSENLAAAIGIATLFLFVGAAVAIFIINGMALSKYEYMEKDLLVLPEVLEKTLREEYEANSKKEIVRITVGVLCCIFGVLLLVAVSCLFPIFEELIIACTAALFLFAAIGVYIIVHTCYLRGAYQKLLQTEEYSKGSKERTVRRVIMDNIYWPIVLAIYLGISFLTHRWDMTWIIWPVAAILSTPVEMMLGRKRK